MMTSWWRHNSDILKCFSAWYCIMNKDRNINLDKFYEANRSKKSKCLNWETALGYSVLDNASAHGGYFVPPCTQNLSWHASTPIMMFPKLMLWMESLQYTHSWCLHFKRINRNFQYHHLMSFKAPQLRPSRRILTTKKNFAMLLN